MNMGMNWELIIMTAFSVVGIIQYAKGICPKAATWIWAISQPILAVGLGAAFSLLPSWVAQGITAFALSQVGYEGVIKSIRSKVSRAGKE